MSKLEVILEKVFPIQIMKNGQGLKALMNVLVYALLLLMAFIFSRSGNGAVGLILAILTIPPMAFGLVYFAFHTLRQNNSVK